MTSCLATFSDLTKGKIISAHIYFFLLRSFVNCSSTLHFRYTSTLMFDFSFCFKFKVYGESLPKLCH